MNNSLLNPKIKHMVVGWCNKNEPQSSCCDGVDLRSHQMFDDTRNIFFRDQSSDVSTRIVKKQEA